MVKKEHDTAVEVERRTSTSLNQVSADKIVIVGLRESDVTCVLNALSAFELGKPSNETDIWIEHNVVVDDQLRRIQVATFSGPDLTPEEIEAFHDSQGCILVYNPDDKESFDQIMNFDIEILKARDNIKPSLLLLSLDTHKSPRQQAPQVHKKDGRELSRTIGSPFIPVQVEKQKNGLKKVYDTMVRMIRDDKVAINEETTAVSLVHHRDHPVSYEQHDCTIL
jgi:hypothetical protein